MSTEEMNACFKGAKLVDFTEQHSGFQHMKRFGKEFVDLVRECKDGKKSIVVLDSGFGGRFASPLVTRDHINLSGDNPLTGPNNPLGPRFPVVQDIYFSDCLTEWRKGVVAGLKEGVKPTNDEQTILRDIGADVCSYNLVPAMLVAAHAGWKVLGIIVPEGMALSPGQIQEINLLTGSK